MCNEKVEKNLKADRQIEEKCRLFFESFENRVEVFEAKAETFVTAEDVKKIILEAQTTNVVHQETFVTAENVKSMISKAQISNFSVLVFMHNFEKYQPFHRYF